MSATTDLPTVTCADCGALMRLRTARKGAGAGKLFWGCSTWPKCNATHGAHPDGRPLGIPGDKASKAARIRAHAAFDPLWASGEMSRGAAYRWMQGALGLSQDEAHIGRFTVEQCERLIRCVEVRAQALARIPVELDARGDAATEAEDRGYRGDDFEGWKAIGDYDTSGMDLPDDH